MFTNTQRKMYRDTAKNTVFSHIAFAVWAVICSDFVITLVTGVYSAMAIQKNINILSLDIKTLSITMLVTFLAEFVNYPLAFCARRGFLLLSRTNQMEQIPSGEIFAPFMSVDFLLKGSLILFLNSLLVYLACIGFFVIILPIQYAYCMAAFIFVDDPSISPIKALTLSRRMMRGNKWGTFLTILPITLLQWAVTVLLSGVPLFATLITSVLQAIQFVTIAVVYNDLKLRQTGFRPNEPTT